MTTLTPEHAAKVLRQRAEKKRAYDLRRNELLARHKAWRDAHPEVVKACGKESRERHRETRLAGKKNYYQRNREYVLQQNAGYARDLAPHVLRSRFVDKDRKAGLTSRDVPDELLPLIKIQILIKRALQEKKDRP